MKNYLLIIMLVLAIVISSILCRQISRSNERIREQIAELEVEIEQSKKPKAVARNSQSTQNQPEAVPSSAHAANMELRKEKRILEKQVTKQKQADNEFDKIISPSLRDKRREITLAELEKLDPAAYTHHLESIQAEERRKREKMEQRMNFIATMDTTFLSAEENNHLKEYLQLLNQAYEMRLNGEKVPREMFTGYLDIRNLVNKYCLAAIGCSNPSLPDAQMNLLIWSQTPRYRVLNPLPSIPSTSKGGRP
jgi:DNA mismatch repair ATPase MutL